MFLSQVLIEPRGERAAEDRVQHLEPGVVGGRSRHAHPANANLRLRRFRFVDDVDLARLELRRVRHFGNERRHAVGLPRSERLLEHRHRRRRRGVADDEERGVVRTIVRAVERLEIGHGERLDRRRQSVCRRAVAMRRTKNDARKRELDERRRVVARLQQSGQPLLLQVDPARSPGTSDAARRRPSAAAHRPASTPGPTGGPPNNQTSWWSTGSRRGTRARRRARAPNASRRLRPASPPPGCRRRTCRSDRRRCPSARSG